MFSNKRKNQSKVGSPPGTVSYTGEKNEEPIEMVLIEYNEPEYKKYELTSIEEFIKKRDLKKNNWLIIYGIHNEENIETLGKNLNIHPLIMEDIVNIYERVKVEFYEDYVFAILKEFKLEVDEILISNHICLLYYQGLVITFVDKKTDLFNPIIERIRGKRGRIRRSGVDFLFYTIIDTIVDNYFITLETLSEKIEDTEEELVTKPTKDLLFSIHRLKSNIIQVRKNVTPSREIINSILRGDSKLIKETDVVYYRDIYDHIVRIIETLESNRDMVSGLLDIYLSSISNKMNEIMKVLTIIATIFIPLTFIAGVYGMNFQYMPELTWKYGYLGIWIFMILVFLGLVYYFKRKKWL